MEMFNSYKKIFLIIGVCLCGVFILSYKMDSCLRRNKNDLNIVHDTSVVRRYEKGLQRDTVIKWYEKVIYKEVKPQRIYVQKTDTVFLEKVKKLDVMLDLKKKGRKLNVFAFNQTDTIAKEYEFENVGKDFTVASKVNGLTLKTKKFYWEGVKSIINYELSITNCKNPYLIIGVETGWNYLDKAGLNIGMSGSYDLKEKNFGLRVGAGMRFQIVR